MTNQNLTLKETLLHEIEQLSDAELEQVLEFVHRYRPASIPSEGSAETPADANSTASDSDNNPVWQAYLESKRERKEVYRRLADS